MLYTISGMSHPPSTFKKVLPSTLFEDDIRNLNALKKFMKVDSEAAAIRHALLVSVYYYGLMSAKELGFSPPVFSGRPT